PLLGALGLLGGAAAAAVLANSNNNESTNNVTNGKLDAGSDTGVVGDNKTNITKPTLSGTVPTGATATVTINGQTYPVTANPDGTWKFTNPTNLPDGTYYPVLHVTQNDVTQNTNLTPFTIDTAAPTIAITSNAVALAANQTATITFTLSEASTDFGSDDITVTGGSLGALTQSATDPKVYTAVFTPSGSGTVASISVGNGRFSDAAANFNTDGSEANNTITLPINATITGELTKISPNDSGAVGDNITNNAKPSFNGKVPAGSTASVTINGIKYPTTVNPDGTWSFTNPTNLPDGTYTPVLDVVTNGQSSSTPLTPFTIDTTPPTIVVTSAASVLVAGQSTTVTFTLSEPVSDLTADDITVTGGTLSTLQKSANDSKVYTATITPSATGTSATISVASGKFSDAAANLNLDGAEANNTISLITNATSSGQLSPASDNSTGTPNDRKTNDKTPEISGKVPAGSTASITLNGQTYPVTVNPDGTWSFTQPTDLPDGTYTPQLNVITNGQSNTTPITPFTIDTTPPTVAISGGPSTLVSGQSTTLTFTLSEASTDLNDADLLVVGGKLGPLLQSATNPLIYTATFIAGSGNTASVSIGSDKFADAAGNHNKDGAEANNIWFGAVTPSTPASSKTALFIAPIADDNIISAAEGAYSTYTVTGKVTGTFAAGDLVELSLNGRTYTALAAADGSFTAQVSMADLKADVGTKINGKVTGTGGDAATAGQDYQVESGSNAGTLTALSIDPLTADNNINITESTVPIAMTGKVTGKYSVGDVVTLTVNGKTFSTISGSDGSFSVLVPAADLIADADTKVEGTVTGTNGTKADAYQDYGVNNSAPVVPNGGNALALTIDTDANNDGFVNYAEIGNNSGTPNATLTVSAAFDKTKVAVGDVVTITDTATGGVVKTITLDPAMIAAGKVTTTFASPGDSATFNVKATLANSAGNVTPEATDTAKLDLSNLGPSPIPGNNPSNKLSAVIEITSDSNNDGVLNISEVNNSTTANVKVSLPTDAKAGDTLVITGTGNAAQTVTLSVAQISARSVLTTFTLPANGSKLDVTATISDTAGNVSNTATDSA
ncbi:MAG: Ig-like domain-containing protein, partial [Limnohabitans sp.]|nr:Ig-like domain-containing protein [Limnohabitans sp.]